MVNSDNSGAEALKAVHECGHDIYFFHVASWGAHRQGVNNDETCCGGTDGLAQETQRPRVSKRSRQSDVEQSLRGTIEPHATGDPKSPTQKLLIVKLSVDVEH